MPSGEAGGAASSSTPEMTCRTSGSSWLPKTLRQVPCSSRYARHWKPGHRTRTCSPGAGRCFCAASCCTAAKSGSIASLSAKPVKVKLQFLPIAYRKLASRPLRRRTNTPLCQKNPLKPRQNQPKPTAPVGSRWRHETCRIAPVLPRSPKPVHEPSNVSKPPQPTIIDLAEKIALELVFAEPGKDTGLLPINSLLGEIEAGFASLPAAEPVRPAVALARQWVDGALEAGALDAAWIERLGKWCG